MGEPSHRPKQGAYVVVQKGGLVGVIEVDRCPFVCLRRCEPRASWHLLRLTSEIRE